MARLFADDGVLRRIVAAADAAPSIHNTQPWSFAVPHDDLLELHGDPDRMLWVADPRCRALHLSCGAALFNVRLAVSLTGHKALVWPLPEPELRPTLLACVEPGQRRPASGVDRELFEAVWHRRTNRAPFSTRPVPGQVWLALEEAAEAEFATLQVLGAEEAWVAMDLAAEADRELAARFDHRVELGWWISETRRTDGIPAAALGSRPAHQPAPVRDLGYVSPAIERPSGTYEPSPQLAVLATAHDEPGDWLRAGQALQRVLLTATVHGLSASFLYQAVELHDMRGTGDTRWWPWSGNPQLVIRFGYGPPAPATPRRPLEEMVMRAENAR
jgi:nitroreductase